MKTDFYYITLEELSQYLNEQKEFDRTAFCNQCSFTMRTLTNIMSGQAKSITYTNYIKLVNACRWWEEKKKIAADF